MSAYTADEFAAHLNARGATTETVTVKDERKDQMKDEFGAIRPLHKVQPGWQIYAISEAGTGKWFEVQSVRALNDGPPASWRVDVTVTDDGLMVSREWSYALHTRTPDEARRAERATS